MIGFFFLPKPFFVPLARIKLSDVPFVTTVFFMSKTKHHFVHSFLIRSCTKTLTAQAWAGPTSIPRGAV